MSARALSSFRETVVAFGAYRAVIRPADLLRQAVAFGERVGLRLAWGVAGSSGFGKLSRRRGGRGFAHELSTFPLVPFMLLMWDFFWKLSLSSPRGDKSPALSLLPDTQGVSGRQEPFQEVSDHLP